jgi:hypothetical protein
MNENIKYNDLIYLVIDGEANEIESSTLFAALNDNFELQSEFQAALKLNRASEAYVTDSAVPIGVTSKLFNQAGLTYVPMATTTAAKVASGSVMSKFMKSTLSSIGFTVLGLILGAVIMYLLNDNWGIDDQNKNQYTINNRQIQFTKSDNSYPEMTSYSEAHVIPKVEKKSQKRIVNFEESAKEMPLLEQVVSEDKPEFIAVITHSQISQNQEAFDLFTSTDFDSKNKLNSEIIPLSNLDFNDLGLSVEVKNASYWNLPKETIYPSEISKFHNMSVSLLYDLSENWKIGGEVRHETFYVKYLSTDALRQDFIFEQQPNLTSIELAVRYLPFNDLIVKPLLQINFGGGHYGYTYRGTVGAEIELYENLAFILNCNYASLSYYHQTKINNSNKIGLNYGINYKF